MNINTLTAVLFEPCKPGRRKIMNNNYLVDDIKSTLKTDDIEFIKYVPADSSQEFLIAINVDETGLLPLNRALRNEFGEVEDIIMGSFMVFQSDTTGEPQSVSQSNVELLCDIFPPEIFVTVKNGIDTDIYILDENETEMLSLASPVSIRTNDGFDWMEESDR